MKEIVNTKYNTKNTPNWCPGCGDFGIWTAFKQACLKQSWDNSNTALVAGIGCHGHIINFVNITNMEEPLNPISLAISSGATFVARAYSGDIEYLRDLITLANKHKGFAIIDVLQPCVTFNKQYSHYFFQKNIYNLQNTDYDFTNKGWAFVKSLEWGENQIPVGIFYQVNQPTYEEQLTHINKPLFEEVKKRDISELLGRFM